MSKINTRGAGRPVARATSPIRSAPPSADGPAVTTHEGHVGYVRDPKSELFLLAVNYFPGEKTFYETPQTRDPRFVELVRAVARDVDAYRDNDAPVTNKRWLREFFHWLRTEANMRTASVVGAVEAAEALRAQGIPGGRRIVDGALERADEPGEAIAYWQKTYPGRLLPKPIKRGIADAANRLYTPFTLLKYDTPSHAIRFGDVVDLTHPIPNSLETAAVFSYAMDRHGRGEIPSTLHMVRKQQSLRRAAEKDARALLSVENLRAAGMTWEDALSLAGSRVPKHQLWEAMIPLMSYTQLRMNLRNFDEAGVSDDVAQLVCEKLTDPARVARSRELPMSFLAAYRAVPSDRWKWALEKALDLCLGNVPKLTGRTLVLIDTSTSMDAPMSDKSELMRWDAAVIFGLAIARRCDAADVVSFSSSARLWGDPDGAHTKVFNRVAGESLLRAINRWKSGGWFLGGGTATAAALRRHFADHSRVFIVTDEQANRDGTEVGRSIPDRVPLYTWNLAGYERGHTPSGSNNRHTFGGLTDKMFKLIPMLEAGQSGKWPWEMDESERLDA